MGGTHSEFAALFRCLVYALFSILLFLTLHFT
nr:MAG TPA: hypothetical protein [Microviridae sp.]